MKNEKLPTKQGPASISPRPTPNNEKTMWKHRRLSSLGLGDVQTPNNEKQPAKHEAISSLGLGRPQLDDEKVTCKHSRESSSGVGVTDAETYQKIKCPIAKNIYILFQTLEDLKVEADRFRKRSTAYGETNSSLGKTVWSFRQARLEREKEIRDIQKDLNVYSEACPLWLFTRQQLNLGLDSWAFLVSKCTPFRYNEVGHLIHHLGNTHQIHTKTGEIVEKHFKTDDGKIFNRIRRCMLMRKTEPYQSLVEKLIPKLKEKNPNFTDGHLKNLAWYKIAFDHILSPFFSCAKIECNRCVHREK